MEKAEQETAAKKAQKNPRWFASRCTANIPKVRRAADLFSEVRPSLSDIIGRIDAAGKDKDVAAVWIKLEGLSAGRGKINELRGAIARLRKANKPVYGELVTAEAGEYLVASACDEVFMPESGTLIIPGVRAEMMFYKGFLDKIGVEFDALKMGKYKGAFEPLTRRDMSPPLRESLESLVDDFYNEMTSGHRRRSAHERFGGEVADGSRIFHGRGREKGGTDRSSPVRRSVREAAATKTQRRVPGYHH